MGKQKFSTERYLRCYCKINKLFEMRANSWMICLHERIPVDRIKCGKTFNSCPIFFCSGYSILQYSSSCLGTARKQNYKILILTWIKQATSVTLFNKQLVSCRNSNLKLKITKTFLPGIATLVNSEGFFDKSTELNRKRLMHRYMWNV